jgi:hypothetical protein
MMACVLKEKPMLTQQRLKEKLEYNPETGLFKWIVKPAGNCKDGWFEGSKSSNRYLNICVDGTIYLAHRLAWLYVYGSWPSKVIDHKDGNTYNNKLNNIRDVSLYANQHNLQKPPTTNKSGYIGVSWKSKQKQWIAQISYNGVKKYLGGYSTPEEASTVYQLAKELYHER